MTSEHVLRVTVGQSSARSATGYSLRSSAASETRPAKDEPLVMERWVSSVRLGEAPGGIAPCRDAVTGLRYSGPHSTSDNSEERAGESVVD
jgi:hypothetical protein